MRDLENETRDVFPSRGALVLCLFRTLSAHSFTFPFRALKDIRNALSLKFRPLLSGEEDVEVVPQVLTRSKRGSGGVAWCISASEIPDEKDGISSAGNVYWPLPLALASVVGGHGIAVFRDDEATASAVFVDGVPVFCRCGPTGKGGDGHTAEEELRLCRGFAVALGREDLSAVWIGSTRAELIETAKETVRRFPHFLDVNISRLALEASLARERTARALWRFSGSVALLGIIFCIVQFTFSLHVRSSLDVLASEGRGLYREMTGDEESIVDPLSQARGKLAELAGDGRDEMPLSLLLAHLGVAWTDGEKGRRVDFPVLEQMRYSGDGADLIGTASTMEAIQALRTAADSRGFRAALGDIQQIPGGGLRFSLSLRRNEQ